MPVPKEFWWPTGSFASAEAWHQDFGLVCAGKLCMLRSIFEKASRKMRSIRSMVAVVIVGLMIAGRVDASALIPQKQEKIAAQTKTSGKGFWNRNKSDTNGEKTKRNAREFGKRFLNELFGPPKPTERPTPSREDIHNALYTKGDRFKHNFLRVFPVLLLLGSGVIAAEVGAKAYAEEVLGTDILNPQKGDLEDVYDK